MNKILGRECGQISGLVAMSTLILILVVAGLVDVYRLQEARSWLYRVASTAALAGASEGRDFASFVEMGGISLDRARAEQVTLSVVQAELAVRGVSDYSVEVRILPEADGGEVPDFPPLPRSSQRNLVSWSSDRPAVGVYLMVRVRTFLLGLVRAEPLVDVHVFAAAGVATQ